MSSTNKWKGRASKTAQQVAASEEDAQHRMLERTPSPIMYDTIEFKIRPPTLAGDALSKVHDGEAEQAEDEDTHDEVTSGITASSDNNKNKAIANTPLHGSKQPSKKRPAPLESAPADLSREDRAKEREKSRQKAMAEMELKKQQQKAERDRKKEEGEGARQESEYNRGVGFGATKPRIEAAEAGKIRQEMEEAEPQKKRPSGGPKLVESREGEDSVQPPRSKEGASTVFTTSRRNSGNIEVINDSEDETDGEGNYIIDPMTGGIKKRKKRTGGGV
ncbi:hypothetical protein P154DRAFT_576123 [Amniculicola lignicola CBS 123094]|uniref:Uncharacterized protein n=1 Tax=Amniculicola lignicola CBS 123094 TaxID=1392246 RepID=A0A6A5WSB0_9PLEO|nr:hypothetical protein P154DRAFT_576123 [Amniculicola lignicola CBS 123094]